MAWILDLLINSKAMLIYGIIASVIIKFIVNNMRLIDAFGLGLMVFLMFNFMVCFLFQGMFNYKP